jgi:hypothetical protein
MVKALFKDTDIGNLIKRQTKAVKFLRKSNKANKLLRDTQNTLHSMMPNPFDAYHASLGWDKAYPHRPLRPVIAGKTRWWSIIKQNKRFVRIKPALVPVFERLLDDDEIKAAKKLSFEFAANDWKVMEQLVDLLAPFKSAIKELEGTLLHSFDHII